MSEASSDNRSLFRIDLERALEAFSLNLQKKSNAVKNIVPYCYDMSNALDGLALIDLSQAASELAQVFKDAKTVQAHRHVLDDFQALIRYQLEITDEASPESHHQELILRKQAFFSKLHIIQPSRLTLAFIRQDIQESIIQDAVLDSELTQSASEILADLEEQISPLQDQEEITPPKKLYSVQDLLNQELQKSPLSKDLPSKDTQGGDHSLAQDKDLSSSDDTMPTFSPVVTNDVFGDLEQSINELGERLLNTEISSSALFERNRQEPAPASKEEVDEPFYIDFPYSNKTKELTRPKEDPTESFLQQDETITTTSIEDHLHEAPTSGAEHSAFEDVSSHNVDVLSDQEHSPIEDSLASQSPSSPGSDDPAMIEQLRATQEDVVKQLTSTDLEEEAKVESILGTIEDPFAELDKLSEQFSMAAHQEQIQPTHTSELIPTIEPMVPELELAPLLPNLNSDPKQEMMHDGITLVDVQNVKSERQAQPTTDTPEIIEVTEVTKVSEPTIAEEPVGNKTSSSLDEWVDHSLTPSLDHPPTELSVQRGNYHASDFDVQRSLNKLQQARGLIPKESSFQMRVLDGLMEEQQNMVVQSVQVNVGLAFSGLAELVESDHVFADQNIIERLLSILSIFPPQKHISVVQQRLLIFIDLHGVKPSDYQLHTANNYLAQICGSLEIKSDLIRITVPSSLLRMEMFCYKRNEDVFAVPTSQLVDAHQYTHDDVLPESTLWDVHGAIDGPHHRISVRSGITEHQIYSFETLGPKILNIFEEFPEEITKPIWLGAVGIDGQNHFYHCVFLERFAL
jgi:hypothetical protein